MPLITVTKAQLELLCQALDSHAYWQLSDEHYRNNSEVRGKGSDDPDMAAEIRACRRLEKRLAMAGVARKR